MATLSKILLIFLGAGIGANARYWLGGWIQVRTGVAFPWNTMIVNISGSLAMGILMAVLVRGSLGGNGRLFLAIGLLGGYTTFSSFSYEVVGLIQERSYLYALWYILGSNVLSILGCALGYIGMRAVTGA